MRATGVELPPDELTTVVHATEGWPAGIYLTALALRSRPDRSESVAVNPSSDGLVADYIRTELLGRLSDDELGFLLDASALERLSGPLCDAVMQRTDSATRLEELARTNLLLIPLDDRREWYRFHHLLRDHLLAELNRRSMERRRRLHSRAAAWHEAEADVETALEYALLARDIELAARLLPELAQRAYNSGRVASLRRWFEAVDRPVGHERIRTSPSLAPSSSLCWTTRSRRSVGRSTCTTSRRSMRMTLTRSRCSASAVRSSVAAAWTPCVPMRKRRLRPSARKANGDHWRSWFGVSPSWHHPIWSLQKRRSRRQRPTLGSSGSPRGPPRRRSRTAL